MARKSTSRTARWEAACTAAREALDAARAAVEEAQSALTDLDDIRSEYEEWKDNLPENLAQSALGEKLETVSGLYIPVDSNDLDEIEGVIDEAEGMDLPLGFGRD
jgi:phage shock protein A